MVAGLLVLHTHENMKKRNEKENEIADNLSPFVQFLRSEISKKET